jgi:hypothetical protein
MSASVRKGKCEYLRVKYGFLFHGPSSSSSKWVEGDTGVFSTLGREYSAHTSKYPCARFLF